MKHIYKAGGVRKTKDGVEYSIRAVGDNDLAIMLSKGWVDSLDKIKPVEVKQPELIEEVKPAKVEDKKEVSTKSKAKKTKGN